MVDRERQWEERLAVPVLVAALASVPAIFLTLLDDPYATVGTVANSLLGAVLVAETVILFAISADKRQWLVKHAWLVLITVVVIIGVVLAIGPVQLLRLLRVVGALRVVRAGRIIKAARILRERAGLTGRWTNAVSVAGGLLAAAFVGVVLSDPTSQTRTLLDEWVGDAWSLVLVVVAGVILAGATFVVMRRGRTPDPRRPGGAPSGTPPGSARPRPRTARR